MLGYSEARRAALAAQRLHRRRPPGPAGARSVRAVADRLSVLQVDSVNILARAHYLPVYSRLGPYDQALLDRLSHRSPRSWTEYWAHEASLVPTRLRPALVAVQRRTWISATDVEGALRAELSAGILDLLENSRPLTARQVEARLGDHGRYEGHWGWNWSVVRRVLEDLFASGRIASAGRNAQFERRFFPVSRLTQDADTPEPHAAAVELVRAASRALGVATDTSLADYYRIPVKAARTAAQELGRAGVLEPVRLPAPGGRTVPAWRHAEATVPRTATGRALVSPFDPLVFHRPRVESLFGVRYRLGIYTPAARRTRGYYSLLFLLGEQLVAQVDLKADRAARLLLVRGVWSEDPAAVPGGPENDGGPARNPRAGVRQVVSELAAELAELSRWLVLEETVLDADAEGDLAPELRRTLRKLPVF
ncbi:DNA glycosylase AlkZ-like family protein [Citricoccus sp. I39-566]|uniref:winged helix-turn-helix domain-containing protein n=1 Tax=Citricoccus sp. I39-566 TaxID=3073268 RepID=UPI00286A4374|nr:crosslink repair DNA glycosylase YcaQ family protein [Citricoccus sp. I39-566]WMY77724.1 crosslink repair DNA glycosylase YcaQ family protein [Citricoccus sp. I39-566]